jgi:hypothetical protein
MLTARDVEKHFETNAEDEPLPLTVESVQQQEIIFPQAAWSGLFARWRDAVAACTEAALENLCAALLVAAGMTIAEMPGGNRRKLFTRIFTCFF